MAKPTFTAGAVLAAAKLTQIADLLWGSDGWQTPTLLNSWVNYGGTNATAAYRKHGGSVYLQGVVKSGTAATIMQLPVGYRPLASIAFLVPCSDTGGSGGAWARLIIDTNGDVRYLYTSGNPTIHIILNCCFTAEA